MRQLLLLTCVLAALAGFAGLQVKSQQPATRDDKAPAKTETPKVDPKADQCLKAMSKYLADLKTFSFQATEYFDEVDDDGQKIQFSNDRFVTESRPDKLNVVNVGDTADSVFYYNGKTATVYDRRQKTYATVKVPATIDAMLDQLHDEYDTDQTLADFMFSDPYKILTENVVSGKDLGESYVDKIKCRHLAYRQKSLDWQIWIDAGEQPLPRKFVITFKSEAEQPQYVAVFHIWDLHPKLTEGQFDFQPPEGVRKVDFLNRHADVRPIEKKNNK